MKKMNNTGQVSMEFIITILFVLGVFLLGLFLFQNRMLVNQNNFQAWEAKDMADRISRNINNVYLMDNTSEYYDYLYWDEGNKTVEAGERAIRVYYSSGRFSSSAIIADVNWLVSDINGQIYFKKENNVVVVSYE
jgi:uncharacterized protein (UPF0333 family)